MTESDSVTGVNGSEIAIIGMACRFPGASSPAQYWENLWKGKESISFLSDEELEDNVADRVGNYVRAAAVLDGIELFDAALFGFTPAEARLMDPQHRLFLECAWETFEDAGYDAEVYPAPIGVFAGARTNTYLMSLVQRPDLVRSLGAFQIGLGNDLGFLSTRVSYKFNLRGPSYSVQTACSTGLVAVHLACHSLLVDECRMALAGAVAVNVPQRVGYTHQPDGIFSPDGHCRAFDKQARGTVFGSGAGAVLLKRLEDALADGDQVYAVIKGSATNNDGAGKASFTAPGVSGQSSVISEALVAAGVSPDTISYVEAHGTGTALGDLVELRALEKAFRSSTERTGFCGVGSVKSNFGHLDAAAGIASLIKTALALHHKRLPPSLHFTVPNPEIDFERSPFYVNSRSKEWVPQGKVRRAGVSSLGVGGTNAHVVVEEAPPREVPDSPQRPHLLVFSANSGEALEVASDRLANWLDKNGSANLADIAYTLQVGRRPLRHRRTLVASNSREAAALLRVGNYRTGRNDIHDPPIAFLFPGQGQHAVSKGQALYNSEPAFRAATDECAETLKTHLGWDVRSFLCQEQGSPKDRETDRTDVAQPVLFTFYYALTQLWLSWGVRPRALAGHSLGEYVAACVAEVFSLADALRLVAARGRLMQETKPGAMLAVPLPALELSPFLKKGISIAAVNEVARCVVSGSLDAIEDVEVRLRKADIPCRRLRTSHAFHSKMMEPVVAPFRRELQTARLCPPRLPLVSNVTGTWLNADQATDPEYWIAQLRSTVLFADCIGELLHEKSRLFVDTGPDRALSQMVRRHPNWVPERVILAPLVDQDHVGPGTETCLNALGDLWIAGSPVDWPGVHAGQKRHRVSLPTYPFQRTPYWIQPDRLAQSGSVPDRNTDITDWFYAPSWQRSVVPRGIRSKNAEARCRILFADNLGAAAAMARNFEQAGDTVVQVTPGPSFRVDGTTYTIDPECPADYARLIGDVVSGGFSLTSVTHLWTLDAETTERPGGSRRFHEVQVAGLYSLFKLGQAMLHHRVKGVDLWIVTNRLSAIEGGDVIDPDKSTLAAFCKVFPQEADGIACHLLDVDWPDDELERHRLACALVAEVRSSASDTVVAWRGPRRWTQCYTPMPLPAGGTATRTLPERGVYLITGGLGAIGLLLSERLSARTPRLVLVGRSPFPDRLEWDRWIAEHPDEDTTSRRIVRLRQLEKLGAEVLTYTADVADETRMRDVVKDVLSRFGRLDGVIHAAGVTRGDSVFRPIAEFGPDESETQFRPKVYGSRVLAKVLHGLPVGFCLLFSSNASVLGGLGLAGYAAGNAFMDSFAISRIGDSGMEWISVNWDQWPEETKHYTGFKTGTDKYTMSVSESLDAFERVVTMADAGQVVVSTGDLDGRLRRWLTRDQPFQAPPADSLEPRPQLSSDYVPPQNKNEEVIARAWSSVLGIANVGVYDSFFELGGDSLLAIRLVSQISEELGVEVPLTSLFQSPTVSGLADAVRELSIGSSSLTSTPGENRHVT